MQVCTLYAILLLTKTKTIKKIIAWNKVNHENWNQILLKNIYIKKEKKKYIYIYIYICVYKRISSQL